MVVKHSIKSKKSPETLHFFIPKHGHAMVNGVFCDTDLDNLYNYKTHSRQTLCKTVIALNDPPIIAHVGNPIFHVVNFASAIVLVLNM